MKHVIVIDIGGTNIRIGIMNQQGKLSLENSKKLSKINTNEELIQIIVKEIDFIYKKTNDYIEGISISVAGPLRKNKTSFFFTAHSIEIDLAEPLEQRFSIPVVIANDTEAAIVAIQQKLYPKKQDVVFVTISTGIGVGAIINGHLISGYTGSAGEFGAILIPTNFSKKFLSWEEYCSGKRDDKVGIIHTYKVWAKYNKKTVNKTYLNPKDLFDAHKNKSKDIEGFMDEIGKINSKGIMNIIFAYNPEVIIFGGSIAQNNYDIIINSIEKYIDKTKISPFPKFKKSTLGDSVSLYGAGYIFFKKNNLK